MKEAFNVLINRQIYGKYGTIELSISKEQFADADNEARSCYWVEANMVNADGEKEWLANTECGSIEEADVIFRSYRDRCGFILAGKEALDKALKGNFWGV